MATPVSSQPPLTSPQPLPHEVQAASTTSLILEAVFGLSGILGLGHMYSGRVARGIGLMVFWWIYIAIAVFLSSITAGLAAFLLGPIYVAFPLLSGVNASAYVKKTQATVSWTPVLIGGVGGCLLLLAFICLLATVGVISLAALSSMFQSQ